MSIVRTGPPPDAFAVVMATGILSVGAGLHGYRSLSVGLLYAAVAAFVGLLVWIVIGGPDVGRWLRTARDPDVVLRAFSTVAAATVLATALRQLPVPAWVTDVLAAVGLVGWLVLMPVVVRGVSTTPPQDLRRRVRGAWLLVSVATSGLATAAADLGTRAGSPLVLTVSAALWLLALVLYVLVVALVVWRLAGGRPEPSAFTPDTWVLMGALAIAALAGDHLQDALRTTGAAPALTAAAHGLTDTAQVAALVWVPVLLVARGWAVRHAPEMLGYRTAWWAAVFPVGMLAASSAATSRTWPFPTLDSFSLVVFWVALVFWVVVAIGLARHTVQVIRPPARRP